MATLQELPDGVLSAILARLDQEGKQNLFEAARALRWHPSFKSFFKTTFSFSPALNSGDWPQKTSSRHDAWSLVNWPRPAGGVRTAEINANLSSREQHYEVMSLLDQIQTQPRALQVLGAAETLNMQGVTATTKQIDLLVKVVQSLLRACPSATTVVLPSVPATMLRYLMHATQQHPALRHLSVLSWSEAALRDSWHLPHNPAAVTESLRGLRQLRSLDLVLVPAPRRHGQSLAHSRGPTSMDANPNAIPEAALDLAPLSSLTALTRLALHARPQANQPSVVCVGLAEVARGCHRLQRLELRTRMLMAAQHPAQRVPCSSLAAATHCHLDEAPLWPSLTEVVIEESLSPSEVASLQLLGAPRLARLELPQGLDLPMCPEREALRLYSQHLQMTAACMARGAPHSLTLHRLISETSEFAPAVVESLLGRSLQQAPPAAAIDGHLMYDILGDASRSKQVDSLLMGLEPLSRRLRRLNVSGLLLQRIEDAVALAHALPSLEELTLCAAGADSLAALAAAARHLRQLRRVEVHVSAGGKHTRELLLSLCASLQSRLSAGGWHAGSVVRLILIGCGRKATAAVQAVKAAWESQHEAYAQRNSWYVPSSIVQVVTDSLPDI